MITELIKWSLLFSLCTKIGRHHSHLTLLTHLVPDSPCGRTRSIRRTFFSLFQQLFLWLTRLHAKWRYQSEGEWWEEGEGEKYLYIAHPYVGGKRRGGSQFSSATEASACHGWGSVSQHFSLVTKVCIALQFSISQLLLDTVTDAFHWWVNLSSHTATVPVMDHNIQLFLTPSTLCVTKASVLYI